MSERLPHLEAIFRSLASVGYVPKSPPTRNYNCIAYAVGDENHRWVGYRCAGYWPDGAKEGRTIAALVDALEKLGYVRCGTDHTVEIEFDKVVLYWDGKDDWTHVARQWTDGRWTSKIGDLEDIIHTTPFALVSSNLAYGEIFGYMKRLKSLPPMTFHVSRQPKPRGRKSKVARRSRTRDEP